MWDALPGLAAVLVVLGTLACSDPGGVEAGAAVADAGAPAPTEPPESGAPRGRVLLIGIDGATLRVIDPLRRAGRLPNLARLAAEGVSGPLRSFEPLQSPRIWASIASGKVPEKHGIRRFGYRDSQGRVRLFLSTHRKGHALWNITSEAGLSTSVVNWWTTYPPEPIDGVMVTDHAFPSEFAARLDAFGAQVVENESPVIYPVGWLENLVRIVERGDTSTSTGSPFEPTSSFPAFVDTEDLEVIRRNDGVVVALALEIEAELRREVFLVYLKGVDRVSHHLWGMLEPPDLYPAHLRPSPEERAFGAEALYRYYAYTDALIGLLLDRYGPEDLVMVVSDHGFEAGVLHDHLTGNHLGGDAVNAVLFARGPGIPAGRPAGPVTVNDVTPTILTWLGLPTALDMDGSPAAFLGRSGPHPIASYDTRPIERVGDIHRGSHDQLVGELRAIGYIE